MADQNLPTPIDPRLRLHLDDDFVEYYNKHLAIKPATHNIRIEDIRAYPEKFAAPWSHDFIHEPFVQDRKIQSDDGHVFTVRCYHPDPTTSSFGEGPYPIHINFHGGGFVLGDLHSDAELCMLIRNRIGIIVMDVEYRLSPENPFGKGHDDAWATIKWVIENGQTINGKPDSISVGGISAGGHISAVMQQLARDAKIDLKLAILAVPGVGHDSKKGPSPSPYPSFTENEFAPCLNSKRLQFFRSLYEPKNEEEISEINSRPAFYKSPFDGDLRGLCNTYIATAECDPLRDEGEAFGRSLIEAGVQVTMRRFNGVPHPFMHMLQIKKSQLYMADVCDRLQAAHSLKR